MIKDINEGFIAQGLIRKTLYQLNHLERKENDFPFSNCFEIHSSVNKRT